jgi:hypothetical protein
MSNITKQQTNKAFEQLRSLNLIQKASLLHYIYGKLEYDVRFVEALKQGMHFIEQQKI